MAFGKTFTELIKQLKKQNLDPQQCVYMVQFKNMTLPIYTFPYRNKRIEEGNLVDPRVRIEVKTKHGFFPITFLLDSGADVTSLPLVSHGELFDFKKDPRQKIMIGVIEGTGV